MSLAKYYQTCGTPKGTPPKTLKRRLARAEAKVAAWCRAQCVERDGYCRLDARVMGDTVSARIGMIPQESYYGPSEFAHMHARRRSKTRGLDPTERHDPKHTLMLCRFHHRLYDAKQIVITALTRKGANGPLKFTGAK